MIPNQIIVRILDHDFTHARLIGLADAIVIQRGHFDDDNQFVSREIQRLPADKYPAIKLCWDGYAWDVGALAGLIETVQGELQQMRD